MSTHIISRELLEVAVQGTESEAFAVQERLMALCQERLNPALGDVFDRWTPADEHWTIDQLDIDAGTFDREGLERGFVEAVTRAIEQFLRERAPHPTNGRAPSRPIRSAGAIQRGTEARYLQRTFLYFLRTGVLPWWFDLPAGKTLEDLIREKWRAGELSDLGPGNFARLLAGEMHQPGVRPRLVRQFSTDFLEALLSGISREGAAAVREVLAKVGRRGLEAPILIRFAGELWVTALAIVLEGDKATADSVIAAFLTTAASSGEPRDPSLFERIAQLWPGSKGLDHRPEEKASPPGDLGRLTRSGPLDRDRQDQRDADAGLDLTEGVFVRCAGVVLLHPFLPQFFRALGVVVNDTLIQPDRALCLLHFLATGARFAPEYDLLLPKVLCNVPWDAPVDSRIELTEAEQEEAVALLEAVVRHWDALGSTSVDGLRGSFLVRPGKLTRSGADDVLQVEPRSYDLLLDRLPWGVGLIKLPWMERFLRVEWRF